jgi:hypothetical protein
MFGRESPVDEKVEQKPISIAVLSLHTHWITADAVKERVHLDVKGAGGAYGEVFTDIVAAADAVAEAAKNRWRPRCTGRC